MDKKNELFEKYMSVRAMMGAMRHKRMADAGPMADPTRGRGRVLALLRLRDGISTREMAEVLGIRVSSLNETLARMEADGVIVRRQSEEDRRVMLVDLTDEGRALKAPNNNLPDLLFGDFSEEEAEQLGGYFDRMIAAMETELGEKAATVIERDREKRRRFFEERGHHGPEGAPHGKHGDDCGERRHGDQEHGFRHGRSHGHGERRHEDAWR